jgi:protein-tyrosine phosphatase
VEREHPSVGDAAHRPNRVKRASEFAATIASVTVAAPGQSIDVPGVANLRDIGGYATRDRARVRTGLLYRSAGLANLKPSEPAFTRLGVRSVYDMRTTRERLVGPDRIPDEVDLVVVDVLRGRRGAARAGSEAYREIVSLPSALDAYRLFFSDLALGRTPALFHCTAGVDRTGWAAAALLMLLHVSEEHVMHDFLLSSGARVEHLTAALDEMRSRYGTIERYFDLGLGLDVDVQSAIRIAFIERD